MLHHLLIVTAITKDSILPDLEDEVATVLSSAGNYLQPDTALQTSRLHSLATSLAEPQISQHSSSLEIATSGSVS